jgi:hypothetical protein
MECSICLNAIVSTDKSFKTDCNHCFHEQCISGWIEHDKKSCPNCRHPINQNLLDKISSYKPCLTGPPPIPTFLEGLRRWN